MQMKVQKKSGFFSKECLSKDSKIAVHVSNIELGILVESKIKLNAMGIMYYVIKGHGLNTRQNTMEELPVWYSGEGAG